MLRAWWRHMSCRSTCHSTCHNTFPTCQHLPHHAIATALAKSDRLGSSRHCTCPSIAPHTISSMSEKRPVHIIKSCLASPCCSTCTQTITGLRIWRNVSNQELPLGFLMHDTVFEANVILSRFWHKLSETKENLVQHGHGLFAKAGHNFAYYTCVIANVC